MKVDNQFHISRVFTLAGEPCKRQTRHTLTQREEPDWTLSLWNAAVYL